MQEIIPYKPEEPWNYDRPWGLSYKALFPHPNIQLFNDPWTAEFEERDCSKFGREDK